MSNIVGFSFLVFLALTCQVEIGSSDISNSILGYLGLHKLLTTTHYGSLDENAIKIIFEYYIHKHKKKYPDSQEKERRLRIFIDNLKKYDTCNTGEMGTATYGPDEFADWTAEEFKERMLGLDPKFHQASAEMFGRRKRDTVSTSNGSLTLTSTNIPTNFDWRDEGAVTAVKYQGACGACWAFSATGNFEGLYKIKYNVLQTFSEQQIIDCDTKSNGCGGGWIQNAVDYVNQAGGLQLDESYPNIDSEQQCKADTSKAVVRVTQTVQLPQRDEQAMAQYLYENGPISVAVNADALYGYTGGIAHPTEEMCSKSEDAVNHAILLVGFGVREVRANNTVKQMPYWIGKNQWGSSWGENGYWYFYRGDSVCAIDSYPNSAVIG